MWVPVTKTGSSARATSAASSLKLQGELLKANFWNLFLTPTVLLLAVISPSYLWKAEYLVA